MSIVVFKPAKGDLRLYTLCLFLALGSFEWGYNIGIIATIYVNPGFIKALHRPTAAQKGLITAIYYLGTWTCYIFVSGRVSDWVGRRYAAFVGALTTCVGASLQAGASGEGSLAMMVLGRIISGFGNALLSTSVPMYQSEIAPASKRGGLVVLNHLGMVGGLSAAFGAGFSFSHWKTGSSAENAWRYSIILQIFPSLIFCAGLFFVVETPRWLLTQNRDGEALEVLHWLRGAKAPSESVVIELENIKTNLEEHRSSCSPSKSKLIYLFTSSPLRSRLWRATALQFIAQICGATAIKYYLPTIFIALGLGKEMALMASAIESTLKMGFSILEIFLIEWAGRRKTLLAGSAIMIFSLLINGTLPLVYPEHVNRAADYTCIVFVFFFAFAYSIGFGPNAWVYGTEIFPTHICAQGLHITASAGAVGSVISAQLWPVGQENIGAKTYYVFMAFNMMSFAVLFLFYPETKGKTLEEIDGIFGRMLGEDVERGMVDTSENSIEGDDTRVSSVEEEGEVMPTDEERVIFDGKVWPQYTESG